MRRSHLRYKVNLTFRFSSGRYRPRTFIMTLQFRHVEDRKRRFSYDTSVRIFENQSRILRGHIESESARDDGWRDRHWDRPSGSKPSSGCVLRRIPRGCTATLQLQNPVEMILCDPYIEGRFRRGRIYRIVGCLGDVRDLCVQFCVCSGVFTELGGDGCVKEIFFRSRNVKGGCITTYLGRSWFLRVLEINNNAKNGSGTNPRDSET